MSQVSHGFIPSWNDGNEDQEKSMGGAQDPTPAGLVPST
jgi:hypothetical protein